jgi:esterase/lipase superfamily enzyme
MGNRALTSALSSIVPRMKNQAPMFHEVVLTAPDIDADVFKRDIAPRITRAARRVTLYASSNDEALALSKRLHGYARAGESGADLVVVDGVETVDVSNVDTSLVGHSYYGSNDTVLADLFYVLTEPKPARSRTWLSPVPIGSMVYWVFERESAGLRAASGQENAVR